MGSTSDLNRQGIGGYTDELARTMRVLKDKQGGRVKVVALPPVLLGGINSFRLLRLVVEVEHWAERLEGGDGVLLKKTRVGVVNKIGEHRVGVVRDPEEKVDTLLREVEGWKKMRVRSLAWANMPERMKPLSEEGEKAVLDPGFRIRIHFLRIRIRIQWIRMEANTDPNTDPDPDPIRIQGFNDQKLKKNNSCKKKN